ncbi:MAG: hypothetical protein LBD46_06555 [Endomicrobium sp.]|jgi:hypothetical protein|nr:hypothetical protein [Endomicrobium sp.]
MAFTDNSFTPATFDELLQIVVKQWNTEFNTNYDVETFKGTNAYRFAYVFIQTQIEQQATIAEIYARLQVYFENINARINNPKTTNNGIIEAMRDKGYIGSVRENTQAQAGSLAVAVVVDTQADNYETKKSEILNIIKDNSVAGLFYDGTESGDLQLTNGQSITFAFTPSENIPTLLRITITYAKGSKYARISDDEVKEKLLFNLAALYNLGNDFMPERYFEINRDAPYAADILLEYSNSKTNNVFTSAVYTSAFTELFTFDPANIQVTQHE